MKYLPIVVFLIAALLGANTMAQQSNPYFKIEGHWEQGGTLFGSLLQPGKIRIGDRVLNTTADGRFVFGLGRDQKPDFAVDYIDSSGKEHRYHYQVKERSYNIQRIEGVQQKHVTPPAEVTERIRREGRQVSLARTLDGDSADFTQTFIWPLGGIITGVYGSQRVYNGVPKSPHYGVDIAAPQGTKVRAPAAGLVTLAADDLYYSGGTLIVDHGHGLSSTFIHLSKILVEKGQRVEQGDYIAEVGATGRATGPHLDWRMNWFKTRIDPQLLMQDIPMPKPAP